MQEHSFATEKFQSCAIPTWCNLENFSCGLSSGYQKQFEELREKAQKEKDIYHMMYGEKT